MKKLTKFILAMLLGASLVACGNSSTTEETPTETAESTTETPTETAAEKDYRIVYVVAALGDKSFADSGEAGMEILRNEGYDVDTLQIGYDNATYADQILDKIDEGFNMIIGSSSYYDVCHDLASEYPDVKFVIFDTKPKEEVFDNEAIIFYPQNEGSYLVGYLAAAMSKTGVVAVNVGQKNPVIQDFVTGYVNGVIDYNAENGTSVKVITAEVGGDKPWTSPDMMKSLCETQITNENADVLYQVAGGSGLGLFEACHDHEGTLAIGVDSDQYQTVSEGENPEIADVILTSMLKEVGNSLVYLIHEIEKGENVWAKETSLGASLDFVGYVDNDHYKELAPEDVRNAVSELKDQIKAGSLTVKSFYDFGSEAEYEEYLKNVQ